MNKIFFSLLFIILFSIPALACLNGEQMVLANSEVLYADHEGNVPYGHSFRTREQLEEFLVKLEKGYHDTKELDYLSDQGFILIVLGRYKEAIQLYKKIESMKPGRYSTYSNMGTAYELIGENKEALKWIEKAVKINPESHSGSEWIHVNILKAKIKGDDYISSMHLIGKDFGNEEYPKSNLNLEELENLRMQVYYQLNERISFVSPKDKIVAQLLFDLGNIAFLMDSKADAGDDYRLAAEYGFDSSLMEKRLKLCPPEEPVDEKVLNYVHESKGFDNMETLLSLAALLLSGIVVFIFRKKIALLLR
ncbi:tetratricopeptide repeat protein [Chryseobacterium sp. Mn2064]|uniref:tetratricopeptide repeat protein n=1 Tax=Chryseobacterium sp. Mn2064 TaxID=3395263 RepID=UPI003BD090E5